MNCKNCGQQLNSDKKFCGNCGQKVLAENIECPKCQTVNPASTKFCSECGCRLGEVDLIDKSELKITEPKVNLDDKVNNEAKGNASSFLCKPLTVAIIIVVFNLLPTRKDNIFGWLYLYFCFIGIFQAGVYFYYKNFRFVMSKEFRKQTAFYICIIFTIITLMSPEKQMITELGFSNIETYVILFLFSALYSIWAFFMLGMRPLAIY